MQTTFAQLPHLRKRFVGKKIVFRGGAFDLVHVGHVETLKFSKSQGDLLVVGVSSDADVRRRKGKNRPVRPERDRLRVVDAFKYVDYSFVMPDSKPEASPMQQSIEKLRPDVLVEYADGTEWLQFTGLLESWGVKVVMDHGAKLNSTTSILARSKQRVEA